MPGTWKPLQSTLIPIVGTLDGSTGGHRSDGSIPDKVGRLAGASGSPSSVETGVTIQTSGPLDRERRLPVDLKGIPGRQSSVCVASGTESKLSPRMLLREASIDSIAITHPGLHGHP